MPCAHAASMRQGMGHAAAVLAYFVEAATTCGQASSQEVSAWLDTGLELAQAFVGCAELLAAASAVALAGLGAGPSTAEAAFDCQQAAMLSAAIMADALCASLPELGAGSGAAPPPATTGGTAGSKCRLRRLAVHCCHALLVLLGTACTDLRTGNLILLKVGEAAGSSDREAADAAREAAAHDYGGAVRVLVHLASALVQLTSMANREQLDRLTEESGPPWDRLLVWQFEDPAAAGSPSPASSLTRQLRLWEVCACPKLIAQAATQVRLPTPSLLEALFWPHMQCGCALALNLELGHCRPAGPAGAALRVVRLRALAPPPSHRPCPQMPACRATASAC